LSFGSNVGAGPDWPRTPDALNDEPATPKPSVAVPHTPAGTERWSPPLPGLFGSVKRGPNGNPPVWPRTPYAGRDAPHTPDDVSDSPPTPLSSCDQPRTPAYGVRRDRKSTRLNSSHQIISYAVFCLKTKKTP